MLGFANSEAARYAERKHDLGSKAMRYERDKLKWNGWGWRDGGYDFGPGEAHFWSYLQQELGMASLPATPATAFADLDIPASRLNEAQQAFLADLLGEGLCLDAYERVFHARGRSYHDLLALRSGRLGELPDAVVYPRTAAEVATLLEFARAQQLALIPFGGGSSVVGGVNAARAPGQQGILTLDTSRLNRLLRLDPISRLATFEAGIYGPALEAILNRQGFTAGHTPQSFEFSTLGGWIAARGAGDRSNKYGKIEDMLAGARVITPRGEWRTLTLPASAAGPDLRQLIAGSEGLFGVIVEATLRIHPLPAVQHHTGFLFRDFAAGVAALRGLAQSAHPPAMLRLSDEKSTRFLLNFRRQPGSTTPAWLKRLLSWQGYETPALLLVGLEGDGGDVRQAQAGLTAACLAAGGFPLGTKAGASWSQSRYSTPYLRDALLEKGVAVETLETATSWARLPALYAAVRAALEASIAAGLGGDERGYVMTHISHVYPDGASLYFTFAFPQRLGHEAEQYTRIKTAACEAIVAHDATLSHHHGIGADHAPWLPRETGEVGMQVLQAIKTRLDPEAVMNPGKWL